VIEPIAFSGNTIHTTTNAVAKDETLPFGLKSKALHLFRLHQSFPRLERPMVQLTRRQGMS
jgi:hypothetical protein